MEFNLTEAIEVLERTPSIFEHMLVGMNPGWVENSEGPATFSPFDILGHLIDGEETDWITRAETILASGTSKPFEPYDRFRHFERNKGKTVNNLVDEFKVLRFENLQVLRKWKLTESDLDKEGQHPELGRVTLRQLLATWVVHDLGHIGQMVRVMAKQLSQDVGPWEAYLSVLKSGPGQK